MSNTTLFVNISVKELQQINADHNTYSSTKSVGQQFLNTAVLTSYVQVIVSVLSKNPLVLGKKLWLNNNKIVTPYETQNKFKTDLTLLLL